MLPGDTAFTKTAYATIGTGLGAFLISKGIYIPNDETLVLIAFAITMRALYNKLSGPVSEYLENSINVHCGDNDENVLFQFLFLGDKREMAVFFDCRKGKNHQHNCRNGRIP